MDLPHASLLVDPQNTVSVIITCKTLKTWTVENVRGLLALSQMRSGDRRQLAVVTVGVSDDPFAYMSWCAQPDDTSSF